MIPQSQPSVLGQLEENSKNIILISLVNVKGLSKTVSVFTYIELSKDSEFRIVGVVLEKKKRYR